MQENVIGHHGGTYESDQHNTDPRGIEGTAIPFISCGISGEIIIAVVMNVMLMTITSAIRIFSMSL